MQTLGEKEETRRLAAGQIGEVEQKLREVDRRLKAVE
jgi:hypothetical protein